MAEENGNTARPENGNASGSSQTAQPGQVTQSRKMSRAEAGRKGGKTTKERYGEEHFGRIGKIGGKKGGETTKERYGSEFYQKIGRLGGSR
jgi:hypothetical protein